MFNCRQINTPLGELTLISDGKNLISLDFSNGEPPGSFKGQPLTIKKDPVLELAGDELDEYFRGRRREFSVPYRLIGRSFQTKVWQELSRIPYGETISYGELARRIGSPRACRAVGQANNKNPLAIIIPCHRVIGKDGSLTGYASGLDKKAWLLDLERNNIAEQ